MWKGEPHFRLVAGGDDDELNGGALAPPASPHDEYDRYGTPTSPATSSSSSPRSDFGLVGTPDSLGSVHPQLHPSPGVVPAELRDSHHHHHHHQSQPPYPSHQQQPLHQQSRQPPMQPPPPLTIKTEQPAAAFSGGYSVLPTTMGYGFAQDQSQDHYGGSLDMAFGGVPVKSEPDTVDPSFLWNTAPIPAPAPAPAFPPPTSPPTNRVCGVFLWADGMHPLTIDVDHLAAQASASSPSSNSHARGGAPRLAVHVRVRMPSMHDGASAPALQGLHGAVRIAAPWRRTAQCMTFVQYPGAPPVREVGLLDAGTHTGVANLNLGAGNAGAGVVASLPSSSLTRCRWLEDGERLAIFCLFTCYHSCHMRFHVHLSSLYCAFLLGD
jgi:hypothetical protein